MAWLLVVFPSRSFSTVRYGRMLQARSLLGGMLSAMNLRAAQR